MFLRYLSYELGIFHANQTTLCLRNESRTKSEGWSTANLNLGTISCIAQATAAVTKLMPIWRDNNITLGSKMKLMHSLVNSVFLYFCESRTLTAELDKRMLASEM